MFNNFNSKFSLTPASLFVLFLWRGNYNLTPKNLFIICHNSGLFFIYYSLLVETRLTENTKVDFSGILSRDIGVEGARDDRLTTTRTALGRKYVQLTFLAKLIFPFKLTEGCRRHTVTEKAANAF